MKLRNKLVIVGGAVAGVGLASAAYAYFSAGGTGSGTATVGTGVNVTLELDGELPALLPGTAVPVTIRVTNPADAPAQTLTGVTLEVSTVTQVDPGAEGPACTADDFETTAPVLEAPMALAPGEATTVTGSVLLRNLDSNQDNCRGATLELAFTAS